MTARVVHTPVQIPKVPIISSISAILMPSSSPLLSLLTAP
jgi:hypothetical protein